MSYGLILTLGAAAIAAAALSRSAALMVAAVAMLLITLLVAVGRRHVFTAVSVRRTVSRRSVAWGGEIEVTTEIANKKWLPIPWLRVRDHWPRTLETPSGVQEAPSLSGHIVVQSFSLRWQETVRRRHRCRCTQRGPQRFGTIELVGGDPLGFTETALELPAEERFVVLPKVLRLPQPDVLLSTLPGDIDVRRALATDPARLAGVREYRQGDAARAINWRATARRRALHVSEFEPAAESRAFLLLDLRTSTQLMGGLDRTLFELLIVVAATAAAGLAESGCSVGLTSNGQTVGGRSTIDLEPLADALPEVLTALGHIVPLSPPLFEPRLSQEVAAPRAMTAYVLVTSRLSAQAATLVDHLRREAPVTVVFVGEPPPEHAQRVDVRVPAQFDWVHEDALATA